MVKRKLPRDVKRAPNHKSRFGEVIPWTSLKAPLVYFFSAYLLFVPSSPDWVLPAYVHFQQTIKCKLLDERIALVCLCSNCHDVANTGVYSSVIKEPNPKTPDGFSLTSSNANSTMAPLVKRRGPFTTLPDPLLDARIGILETGTALTKTRPSQIYKTIVWVEQQANETLYRTSKGNTDTVLSTLVVSSNPKVERTPFRSSSRKLLHFKPTAQFLALGCKTTAAGETVFRDQSEPPALTPPASNESLPSTSGTLKRRKSNNDSVVGDAKRRKLADSTSALPMEQTRDILQESMEEIGLLHYHPSASGTTTMMANPTNDSVPAKEAPNHDDQPPGDLATCCLLTANLQPSPAAPEEDLPPPAAALAALDGLHLEEAVLLDPIFGGQLLEYLRDNPSLADDVRLPVPGVPLPPSPPPFEINFQGPQIPADDALEDLGEYLGLAPHVLDVGQMDFGFDDIDL